MKIKIALVVLSLSMVGCNTLKKIPGIGGASSEPANNPGLPDMYTVTGTTQKDFDFIPIRVVDSSILVKVTRTKSPEIGEYQCDQFEIFLSTKGVGGGGVRFGYLNLSIGGVSFPVAPKGTQYEITSVLNRSSHDLY